MNFYSQFYTEKKRSLLCNLSPVFCEQEEKEKCNFLIEEIGDICNIEESLGKGYIRTAKKKCKYREKTQGFNMGTI